MKYSMRKESKIYIASHTGLVGSAIKRKLEAEKRKAEGTP